MKVKQKIWLAGICLLLASCINEQVETYDVGQQSSVQFSLSFPSTYATRMAAPTIQADNSFRGIDQIVLIPFAKAGKIENTDTRIGDPFGLYSMLRPVEKENVNVENKLTSTDFLVANNHSALFQNVDVPMGTSSLLFYGHAISSSPADKVAEGSLIPRGLGSNSSDTYQPSDISFGLESILSTVSEPVMAKNLVDFLTQIAKPDVWTGVSGELETIYTNLRALKTGSSRNVQVAVQHLYSSVYSRADAVNIKNAILNAKVAGSDPDKYFITEACRTAETDSPTGNLYFDTDLLGDVSNGSYYPANIGLPDGSAIIEWNETEKKFENVYYEDAAIPGTSLTYTPMRWFTYPPELWYFANSRVKTAVASRKEYYDPSKSTWNDILSGYATDNGTVSITTRSVAMTDPVQYGVACLAFKVKATASPLKDDKDADVNVPGSGFPVTAILIGGQRDVDFAFQPSSNTTGDYVIYDRFTGLAATTTDWGDSYAYTLALQTDKDEKLNIAVEFLNTGSDFYGKDGNLIPNGCHFYLETTLDPKATSGVTGYNAETSNKVFEQDHKTFVELTITDLKNALYHIPDLRLPMVNASLRVNLRWQRGTLVSTDLKI